jgi:GNAT superfamily N-acetyltransferase
MVLPDGFRFASAEDAEALVELVDLASHGSAESYWAEDAPSDLPARQYGTRIQAERAERGEWIVHDPGCGPVAGFHGYPKTNRDPVEAEQTPLYAPVLRLEARSVPSWMLQVFATQPDYRRRGLGRQMLSIAEAIARYSGLSRIALVVGDGNTLALPAYYAAGFEETSREAMHPDDIHGPGAFWLLLSKAI